MRSRATSQGKSARATLAGIIDGVTDGARPAALAKGTLRTRRDALLAALEGRPTAAHRFLLRRGLEHIDDLQASISSIEAEVATRLAEKSDALCTIPGVSVTIATALIAELGTEMSVFPDEQYVASWAGLCPGSHESAREKKSTKTPEERIGLPHALGARLESQGSMRRDG